MVREIYDIISDMAEVLNITTEMLRKYLVEYQSKNNCGKVTIDKVVASTSEIYIID